MSDGIHLEPGEKLGGRYIIEGEIARGGGGIVYAAHQSGIERPVVIKTLLPSALLQEDAYARFLREARVASKLRHPGAVVILDFGTERELAYIVMERLEGKTLKQSLEDEGAQPAWRIRKVLTQLLETLAAAHAIGVIHRDLKPSNIFLCEYHGKTDFVKVIDFGIARVVAGKDGETTITDEGGVMGTPGYLAPELLNGGKALPKADLYAVGIIAHEMLIGQSAFGGGTTLERLTRQARGELMDAPSYVQKSPIYPIIERLRHPDPDLRYYSAEQALNELNALPELDEWTQFTSSLEFKALDTGTPPADRPRLRESLSDDFEIAHLQEATGAPEPRAADPVSDDIPDLLAEARAAESGQPPPTAPGGTDEFFDLADKMLESPAQAAPPPTYAASPSQNNESNMILLYLGGGALGLFILVSAMVGLAVVFSDDQPPEETSADAGEATTAAKTPKAKKVEGPHGVDIVVESTPSGATATTLEGGEVLGVTPFVYTTTARRDNYTLELTREGSATTTLVIDLSRPGQYKAEMESTGKDE